MHAKEIKIEEDNWYKYLVIKTDCLEQLKICLSKGVDGQYNTIEGDGSYNWGTCGEANKGAIDAYGQESVLKFLLDTAEGYGIKHER